MVMEDLTMKMLERIKAGEETATFEKLKPLLRPKGVISGVVEADPAKCNSCGRCIRNCPFACLEMDENGVPRKKPDYICFSCFNCIIACSQDALSIAQTFAVEGGFFDTGFPPVKLPLEPRDAEGKPAEWTEVERIIMNRRSVRNFKKDPVPEPLIRRILEAGRFAPSGGNHQPWKFTVVTDQQFIGELEEACHSVWAGLHAMFKDDEQVVNLVKTVEIGVFDPRVQHGIGCVARKELKVFFNAPVVIFIGCNKKLTGPEMQAGICGDHMNLVAVALGLGVCWSNFGKAVNFIPEIRAKLGFEDPWEVQTSLCVGYPAFKQEGIVPRAFRPITWFRSGSSAPQVEE